MSSKQNNFLPISIVAGAIVIAVGLFYGLSSQGAGLAKVDLVANSKPASAEQEEEKGLNPLLSLTDEDHIFGNPDAPISLIEYSDFECPFCQRFHPTPESLVEEFGDQVNWVYRHYPLSFHEPAATLEASAAECANEQAGNDAFWQYAELIYENTGGNGIGITKDRLISIAGEMDLDEGSFEECLDSGKFKDRIRQDFKNGGKLGVTGTPATFVVNHEIGEQQLVTGAQPFGAVKAVIEEMM